MSPEMGDEDLDRACAHAEERLQAIRRKREGPMTDKPTAEAVLRCLVTEHPCGTDTTARGYPCQCATCKASRRIAALEQERDEARAQAMILREERNQAEEQEQGLAADLRAAHAALDTDHEAQTWARVDEMLAAQALAQKLADAGRDVLAALDFMHGDEADDGSTCTLCTLARALALPGVPPPGSTL